jgi:hypothetical protein
MFKNNSLGFIAADECKNIKARQLFLSGHKEKVLNINQFVNDGFEKVCDVVAFVNPSWTWGYKNINQSLMYADHKSWVYFIVLDSTIVKVGETGNPLGIKGKISYKHEPQPITGSKSRFGRLSSGDTTDHYIRTSLLPYVKNGHNVSLWAKKCEIVTISESIGGIEQQVRTTKHKNLEDLYLRHFMDQLGYLPDFNKCMK